MRVVLFTVGIVNCISITRLEIPFVQIGCLCGGASGRSTLTVTMY